MRVSNALTVFTHLLALAGFLSLSLTGAVGPPVIAVFSFSLVLSFYNERYGKGYYLGHGISTLSALLLVLYAALGVFLMGVEPFKGILEFLILVQVLKLLGRKNMRDIMQIYALSFFQFIAGTIITVNFSYAAAFIIYIAVAVCAVIVFEMRRGALESGGPASDEPELVTPPFLGTSIVLGICILLTAALIFISVPRLGGSYFSSGFLRTGELRSGFSDEVRLGRVGEIKLDGSPVMTVRVLNRDISDVPYPVYWRGVALDEFDGESWRSGSAGYRIYKPGPAGRVIVGGRPAGGVKDIIEQEIITEPLDTDVLFSANLPVGFGSVPGGRVAVLNDSYSLHDRVSYRIKYYAVSDIGVPSPGELRNDDSAYADSMDTYLQLPPLGDRVKELALEITSSDASVYDKALSVKRYLLTNYTYTRTLGRDASGFPLEEFLFTRKEGHCEYFATAMAVLLREAGIPSRVVNGFIGGAPNEHGNFFLVRESDAHSWVEVYFPGHGWVTFDPTPEGQAGADAGAFPLLTSYIDYLRYRWSRYVIDFSRGDQLRLLNEARDKWSWKNKTLFRGQGIKSLLDRRTAAVIAVLILCIWLAASRTRIASCFRRKSKGPRGKASALYTEALGFLTKKGFAKPGSMTAGEFADSLADRSYPGSALMKLLTDTYLGMRFGGPPDEEGLRLLAGLLEKLKRIKA
ncbi:MAG: transglutaminase TgpA family protein [Thermodesulfobacteriota bacterium]